MRIKMKRFLGILLSLAMVVGLFPGMSLTAYAKTYDSLTVGMVLHLGDTINTSTDYKLSTNWLTANTWTLVRGNITSEPPFGNESDSGAYYLLKKSDGSVYVDFKMGQGGLEGCWPVTDTSDGICVESLNGENVTFAVHEASAHTHSFTYSAGGATITATCGAADCPLPVVNNKPTATLTIAAPLHTTYGDGNEAAAVITDTNSIKGDATIQYQTKSGGTYGTATTTAPTGAGDHKASITVGGVTAYVEYTIAQADSTANAPTGLTATYGQTLADVSLTNPSGNTAGTWAWADAGTTSVGAVGSHIFKVNFTPTDTTNYKSVSNVDVTVTVGKAANPATVTNTASVTKGGKTVDLASNVTKNGATGDVSYAISGGENGCSLNGSVLTSGNTTGTVTVNVTVAEDDNYNALAATPITVTISDKATQTITAENVTANYGDTDKKVTATTNGNGTITYTVKDGSADYIDVDASTGALTIKKVGTATVIVTATETDTYAAATKEVTVTINKANAVAATVTANNRTYDGTAKPLVTITGTPTGGTMQYALGTATEATEEYTTSIPTATEAGTYYVWYMVAGDSNHLDSEPECVKAYINKKIITYSNVSGDGSEWKKGSDGSLEFVFKRSEDDDETFVHFTGVKVDETAVAAKDYDAKPGSVIITLKPEFIKTLAVGKHTLTAMFDDGNDVTVTFWILADEKKGSKTDGQKEEIAKRTSDDTSILLPLLIMIDSFAAAIYIMLLKKKTGK